MLCVSSILVRPCVVCVINIGEAVCVSSILVRLCVVCVINIGDEAVCCVCH